ncbi:hypothetical protein [Streptomyces sp. NPDC059072]|uniref:hypothetical protein n=1 Tax=Streptomyces sp. NPDC059072 TaxID=3346715 RepID=UPI0036BB9359
MRTCLPADPETKGGSEATVRIAKADLVPRDVNLRVREGVARLHERGNGARTQRRLYADGHDLASVVTRCAEMTVMP